MNIFNVEFSIVARGLVLAALLGLVAIACSTCQPESQPAADQKAMATSEGSTDGSIKALL
jgi:hypothetical protein